MLIIQLNFWSVTVVTVVAMPTPIKLKATRKKSKNKIHTFVLHLRNCRHCNIYTHTQFPSPNYAPAFLCSEKRDIYFFGSRWTAADVIAFQNCLKAFVVLSAIALQTPKHPFIIFFLCYVMYI